MSDNVEVISEDKTLYTGIHPSLNRRHTLGGNSSLASASDHAPIMWRAVMPTNSRSTLVSSSETEDVGENWMTFDGFMRTTRATSDISSLNRRPGDSAIFALHDVDAFSVQRAKVIRRVSEDRYVRFRNFFKCYEPGMAMEIQARSAFSREHLDAWVNYIMSPKVLHCIVETTGTQQELLDLLMVSAAISKYGESVLMAKDRRGDLDALQNMELHTCEENSQSSPLTSRVPTNSNAETMEFVVRVNEQLLEERRVGGVVLREILTHVSSMKVSVNTSTKSDGNSSLTEEEERLKQVGIRVQTDWFQDTMLKVNGRYLYDAIRQALSDRNTLLWDESKDKPGLRRIQEGDELEVEVIQVERKAASSRHSRPRLPPPPPPPRNSLTTNESLRKVLLIPSSPNASSKGGFTIENRSMSLPDEGIYERNSTTLFGTDNTCRRPLFGATRLRRPRGLPPKRP
ncbi:unnamed protein product [Peronospora belbahrii]|uniref:Uncharacterized protein n=1 Tax=Peronospora belbahrii TaxID=622444 RepID=A0AAU9KYC3_9STRA|nr:unnamed protein product [Peronospora belbahrii]CAH0519311.1 unnamed protein product [Peronospora belbahrii]